MCSRLIHPIAGLASLILLATLVMVATPSIRALAPRTAQQLPASEEAVPG